MRPAELARKGDLDALFAQMDLETASSADRQVYKWLCYAADMGHDAEEMIGDVLEVSSLRYDDDGYEQAAAHWELAVGYLLETDGLRFDALLSVRHLEEALSEFSLGEVAAGINENLDEAPVLAALSGDRKQLLEEFFADTLYRHIRFKMNQLKKLRKIESVPHSVRSYVATSLVKSVRELVGEDIEDGVFVTNG